MHSFYTQPASAIQYERTQTSIIYVKMTSSRLNPLPVTVCDSDISLVQFETFTDTLVCLWLWHIVTVNFFVPCTNTLTYLLIGELMKFN